MSTATQNLGKPTLGRYTLVREVARSNDVVWEGFDPQMNRRVAVKELSLAAHLAGQARRDRIERFYREARAAGAMSHPNIVTIYEVGEDAGRYFIAMEFLEGQTLRDRMGMGGPLPLSEAVAITSALCDALEYAHLRGVVHRDIKPDNVHLPGAGRVVLTDFGIARITHEDQLTVAGQVFGTPSYMSPEQISGGAIDARSDLFSLGVLLYEMVTGHKPFTGDSVVTITYRIAHDPTPPAPGATPGIEMVLARALAKSPADRFASAGEMRSALQAAIAFGGAPRANVTGAFPATPQAAQATAYYGMQTQAGIAPGHDSANNAPAPWGVEGAFPSTSPVITPIPLGDEGGYRCDGRPWAAWAAVLLFIGFLAIGGGWAVSAAYKSQRVQMVYARDQQSYRDAVKQYEAGDYAGAAKEFERLRSSPHGVTASNARQMAVSAYRSLGQAAQKENDLESAEIYFGKAVSLAIPPGDAQAREELAAVQKVRGTFGSAPPIPSDGQGPLGGVLNPSPAPSPAAPAGGANGVSPGNPLASVLGFPSPAPSPLTTNDFTNANNAAAREADALYRQGEAASVRGDQTTALRLWTAAVAAGPGSPAALRAQARITQYNNANDPLGGM